jgi:hypothetical protein
VVAVKPAGGLSGADVLGYSSPSKLVAWLLPWRTLPAIFVATWLVIAWINAQR